MWSDAVKVWLIAYVGLEDKLPRLVHVLPLPARPLSMTTDTPSKAAQGTTQYRNMKETVDVSVGVDSVET